MGDLVKCTVMLDEMSEWGAFNDVYKTFFAGRYPARSAFGADGLRWERRSRSSARRGAPRPGAAANE